MSNIETGTERGGSKNLNTHRLIKAGARIAGAALAITGIGFSGISNASTAKTRSVSENVRPVTPPNLVPGSQHREVTRDRSITFANYNEAASEGPTLRLGAKVLVNCVATDQEGNTWYLINHPQKGFAGYWDETDNFKNGYNGQAVVEAPTVDPRVPACPAPYEPVPITPTNPTTPTPTTIAPPASTIPTTTAPHPTTTVPPTRLETTGSVAHTWTNYSDAGGSEGPSIPDHETVQIDCKVEGFTGSDGNNWWYRIASQPWNNDYYVSADAFYNNGATSGSLIGTPFEDPSVPNC